MPDVILDTCALVDFLASYLPQRCTYKTSGTFTADGRLPQTLVARLNEIVVAHSDDESAHDAEPPVSVGLLVISAFAFVELVRRWGNMVKGRFTPEEMFWFVQAPPPWVNIAPVDDDLLPLLAQVENEAYVKGEWQPLELPDAIHAATALSREGRALLVTGDCRLAALSSLKDRIIHLGK